MNTKINEFEVMAPVGSRESLAAAIQAGADSVYFGIGKLNMRSHSANHFTIDDLREIAATCNEHGIKTYLTVNTVIYDNDIPTMKEIIDAAKEAGISAVIASVLVLYYSMYGHIETMARAVAEGASKVDGAEVVVKRVPETMPPQLFEKAGGKTQTAPVATPQELADYDAIIFGTPTRFGNMSGQMRTFLDQTGGLWASGALYGKLASVFSSTGTGGGQEQTITSTWTTLAHHGMVIVPIGYAAQELFDVSQVRGGTPYGATTIAGGDGSRQPSQEELSIARYQGEYVAGLAVKLNG